MALFFRPVSGVAVWAGLSRWFSGLGWIQGVCCSQWQGGWAWLVPVASTQPLIPTGWSGPEALARSQWVDILGLWMSEPQVCRLPFPRHSFA